MKILLVQPKFSYTKYDLQVVEMPIGLCYLAAVAIQRGHEVAILDCMAEGFSYKQIHNDINTHGLPDDEIKKRIREFKPDIVGISALFSSQYNNAKQISELVKSINTEIITVMGGMHPSVKPFNVLTDKSIDFILQGEADHTFSDLVDALENKKDYTEIDGIGYKDETGPHIKKKEKFIENLDTIPMPARNLLNLECYYKTGLAHGFVLKYKKNMNLITSRGCPGGCVFCTIHLVWGRKFRSRSPENVLAELSEMKKRYGIKHVQFEDDNLTHDIERAQKIFKGMINQKLNLKWNTPNGIALWRMDKETLNLMKEAGCYYVKFAVESGNQRVLKEIIKKPQDLQKSIAHIKYARSIGLKVGSFFVVGFPGETKQEMQDTFDFPYKVKLDYTVYTIAKPQHGTELRKICEEKNCLKIHNELEFESGRCFIDTPDFTSEWLENKIIKEQKRYIKHLFFHQLDTLISLGWLIFKREPLFILRHLGRIFSLS